MLEAYAEIEPRVQSGTFRSYRQVLTETARRVAERLDWPLSETKAGFLAESLSAWPSFDDTVPALAGLRAAGHRLGIISNVDDDLLAGTLHALGVRFDLLVTAEQVRSYKPVAGHFSTARERIGDAPWLHAAQSYFHDVVPARRLGIPVAWINRKGEPIGDAGPPDLELPTLADLARHLTTGP